MILSVCICLACFVLLVMLLRRNGYSLGLPIAYLFALLFIHVPGAIAHIVGSSKLTPDEFTETGIWFTAIGSISFLAGVWVMHLNDGKNVLPWRLARRREFGIFCLIAGLSVTYGLEVLISVPSLGAIIYKAGGIWVLGIMLGLTAALRRGVPKEIALWLVAMSIFPVLTLLRGGFLSFGSIPVFVILARIIITTRSTWRMFVGATLVTLLFFHLFLSYFTNRDEIRAAVWHGAGMETRIERSLNIITDFKLFSPDNTKQLTALDDRLNQNYFVGLAKERIDSGTVGFLHGRSFWEGAIALVPRAVWPDKPVYAGSSHIVTDMTGFKVNENTSYGVGNVLEFYMNFGMTSLIGGFLLLGILFGWLDRKAALAERSGNLGQCILFFLPALAMIHPNGSLVEMTSGGAAGFFAALAWQWLWTNWSKSKDSVRQPNGRQQRRVGESFGISLPVSTISRLEEGVGNGESSSGGAAHV